MKVQISQFWCADTINSCSYDEPHKHYYLVGGNVSVEAGYMTKELLEDDAAREGFITHLLDGLTS